MNTNSIYAALDLHSAHSVLGSMNHDGQWLGWSRFRTDPEQLQRAVRALGGPEVRLTVEASALTRWAVGLLRPLVGQLVICEPRHNRLIAANTTKNDRQDVADLCLLLRLGKLKEVWMGDDRQRQIHRELVYELLNWRDAQRELKALLKARYRQWGVLRVEGTGVFSRTRREPYLAQLPRRGGKADAPASLRPARSRARPMARHPARSPPLGPAVLGIERSEIAKGRSLCPQGSAGGRWQVAEFQKVPGIGEVGAHVFSAIIEDPARFATAQKLIKYARLAITDRSSDGKPLGYQRLERRGHRELKTLSYHAWRTACKSTTGDNAVQRFYRASLTRTHDVRHARLNTQRKILGALWRMWQRRTPFDPDRFFPATDPPVKADGPRAPAPADG